MLSGDERFVTTSTRLFGLADGLALRFDPVLRRIREAVDALDDDAVMTADLDDFSQRLASELHVSPPKVDIAAAMLEPLGRVPVADPELPEISPTAAQSPAPRPGYRLRISVPVTGESDILLARPSPSTAPLSAELADGKVAREWAWPEVLGASAFDRAVEAFEAELTDGAGQLAGQVERFNASLSEHARAAIEQRRQAILSGREFLGSLSTPVSRGEAAPASSWRWLVARVAKWRAPPQNLLLTALVLLVYPWDDVLIDALYAGDSRLPALVVYAVWIVFDFSLIWVVLATGRLLRPAFAYAGIAAVLDVVLAIVYYTVTEYSALYMVAVAILDITWIALIGTVMWVRLHGAGRAETWSGRWLGLGPRTNALVATTSDQADPAEPAGGMDLFVFVIPLILAISVAYAASFAADLTCTGRTAQDACGTYGPSISVGFFDQSAHIIAILLVALAIEGRLLIDRRRREERSLVGVTALGLAVGITASLTASAAHAETLPLTFPLTVQALAIGLATILMLPFLRDPD